MRSDDTIADEETRLDELAYLSALRRTIEMGWCRGLRDDIEFFGPKLEASRDADIKRQYTSILDAAYEAFRIEEVHGQGSLLKLKHPHVIDLLGGDEPRNPPIITPEEVEASQRYWSAKGH